MAVPPFAPGNHPSRIPGTYLLIQLILSGRPLSNTTTTGLPVAYTDWTNSNCRPGRSRLVRLELSPTVFPESPRTTTATSEFLAFSTASFIPALSFTLYPHAHTPPPL